MLFSTILMQLKDNSMKPSFFKPQAEFSYKVLQSLNIKTDHKAKMFSWKHKPLAIQITKN